MKKYLFNYEIIDGLITDNDFINIKERIEKPLKFRR